MTREEAIEWLEVMKENAIFEQNDALNMAISALKDEPLSHEEAWAEIESDLISRADAIEAVHNYYKARFAESSEWDKELKMFVLKDRTIAKDNKEVCKAIKTLPSAEAVQGEWIVEPFRNNWEFKCSVCGWHEHHAYKDAQRHNYCPNCGARMVTE